MKKSIGLLFVASALLSSCAKPQDWNCECECRALGSSQTVTKTTTITQAKQNEANNECGDFGASVVNHNGTWKCKIEPI